MNSREFVVLELRNFDLCYELRRSYQPGAKENVHAEAVEGHPEVALIRASGRNTYFLSEGDKIIITASIKPPLGKKMMSGRVGVHSGNGSDVDLGSLVNMWVFDNPTEALQDHLRRLQSLTGLNRRICSTRAMQLYEMIAKNVPAYRD
ncbi:hypothetical protein JW868_01905 [Candidatus Woesearchaeota archaeon]|nr:hypothetical protein [Candidatus Woesearchaeota archaeon]